MKNIKYILTGIGIVAIATLIGVKTTGVTKEWYLLSLICAIPVLLAMMTWKICNEVSEESESNKH